MKKFAVIVAGGSGSRMGGGIPKQFRNLCGRPVLWWSIKAFHDEDSSTNIIVVLPKDFISLWKAFLESLPNEQKIPHSIVAGGETRSESVRKGLDIIEEIDGLVAVHDGARPLIKPSIIESGWKAAEKNGAAIPVVPVVDSLRHLTERENRAVNRDEFVAVQTPQVFEINLLKKAYEIAGEKSFSDDASVVENLGLNIDLFSGNPENMKVTSPKDLIIATGLMENG